MRRSSRIMLIPKLTHGARSQFRQRTYCVHARNLSSLRPDRPGAHKTPIVDYLWHLRDSVLETEKARAEEKQRKDVERIQDKEIEGKSSDESFTSINYPFSSDLALKEKYVNPWGKIRIGRVVEDLDALAGNISFKHAKSNDNSEQKPLLVTASIDRIILGHRANLKDDIELSGRVSWVGRSSMEIKMQAKSSWTDVPWLSALLTFVALDPVTKKPAQLPPLIVNGIKQEEDFRLGQERNDLRKKIRQQRSSAAITSKRKGILLEHDHDEGRHVTFEEAANLLIHEAKPLLDLPSLAPQDSIPLSHTSLTTALIMQPQQKNTASRIFGGYLVRRAYELAFATAYMFGGSVPRFRELDEVVFKTPVDVGDLVQFKSCVLYTSTSMHDGLHTAHLEVIASVICPEKIKSTLSNSFNFTFEFEDCEGLRNILPESYEDSLKIVTRFQNDLYQKEEDLRSKASDGDS